MARFVRGFVSALAVAALVSFAATPAVAGSITSTGYTPEHDADPAPAMFDAAVMRPIGFVMLVAGTALMVPIGAFTLITRPTDIDKPFNALMREPAEFVFVDPVGTH
jgi:hypothetical protein